MVEIVTPPLASGEYDMDCSGIKNYKLYVEKTKIWEEYCSRDYYIDEPSEVRILKNGIILPSKDIPGYTAGRGGGVCDDKGNFVAGHLTQRQNSGTSAPATYRYPVPEGIPHRRETVVYGGFMYSHFGHMLTESLSRMWYFLENPNCGYKFAFIMEPTAPEKIHFLDFFLMLGLCEEDILLLKEPTRFDSVLVPSQSTYLNNGFADKAIAVYNTIRDSVPPAHHPKIYLTRSGLVPKDILNEEYFEEYYRSLGYEILSPEQLPIKDQIALLSGAKEVACTAGTLSHLILFCHDGVHITMLNRNHHPLLYQQCWINQLRSATCTVIDVYMNLFQNICSPMPHVFLRMQPYVVMPTVHWKQHVFDQTGEDIQDHTISIRDFALEYIEQWIKFATKLPPESLKELNTAFTLANVVIWIQKYLFADELDERTKKKLIDQA